jgi:hypothetical protein
VSSWILFGSGRELIGHRHYGRALDSEGVAPSSGGRIRVDKINNPAACRSSGGVSSQIKLLDLLLSQGIKLLITNNFYLVPGRGLEPAA